MAKEHQVNRRSLLQIAIGGNALAWGTSGPSELEADGKGSSARRGIIRPCGRIPENIGQGIPESLFR
jgi:hypothetical protein